MAKGPFSDVLQKLKDAVVDFSQLNVRTFVGSLDIAISGAGDPDWDALMKKAVTDGKVKLAASTTVRIDGDSDNFEDPDHITAGLREAHANAVKAGLESRHAILETVKSEIKSLIKT